MNRKSKSKQKTKNFSIQKKSKQTAFFKKSFDTLPQQFNNDTTLPYEVARLTVNQKLLYLKTCAKKNCSLQQIFKYYPYTNIESFKFPIQSLLKLSMRNQQKTIQNPQLQSNKEEIQIKSNDFIGKIIKSTDGVHFVQIVDKVQAKKSQILEKSKGILQNQKSQIFNGIAVSIFQDGTIYQGNYHDGLKCGYGLQICVDGDLFIGNWKNGFKKGVGTFYSFGQHQIYKGGWDGDLPHGQAIYITKQSFFEGNFLNGLKNGCGIQKFNNGDYYVGQFSNGDCQGYGQYFWNDGSSYKGDFSKGVRHGYGIWQDGNETFCGGYSMDKKNGIGVYTWKNKRVYKGYYKNDQRYGYGQLYGIGGVVSIKLQYKGGWEKGVKSEAIKYGKKDVEQLHRFLQQEKEFLEKISLKKSKVGHKNCVPNGKCRHT